VHCCFILDDGSAVCYGDNDHGELGDGGYNAHQGSRGMGDGGNGYGANDAGLVDLPPGRAAVKIACGKDHTCAILDEGSVVCWGNPGSGRLGNGRTGEVCHGWNDDTCGENLIPVNLGSGRRAIDIAAGYDWTCAVLDDGGVHCWGGNSHGVLGYDMNKFGNLGDDPLEPGGVADPIYFPGGKAVKVYGTQYTRCVILDVGDVVCWGTSSANGEIPNSHGKSWQDWTNPTDWSLQDDYPPIDLGGRKAFALAAGGGSGNRFQCAMLSAADCDVCRDEIRCWGANDYGQLGYGDKRTRGIVDGDFARDVVDLGAIGVHPSFEVGGYERAAEPTPPDAIEALTVCGYSTCAIVALGRVVCWGRGQCRPARGV
jgi:alpha-tubulin suppressor-like RCC1 family protein